MQLVRETGNWQPDALEWVDDEILFEDVVADAEAAGEDATDGSIMDAD